MKILIKITKEVLRRTQCCLPNDLGRNCAISYAVREFLPDAWTAYQYIDCDLHKPKRYIALPDLAANFINDFDNKTPMERLQMPEFSFEIDVPDSIIDSIGIQEAREIISKSETLEFA